MVDFLAERGHGRRLDFHELRGLSFGTGVVLEVNELRNGFLGLSFLHGSIQFLKRLLLLIPLHGGPLLAHLVDFEGWRVCGLLSN